MQSDPIEHPGETLSNDLRRRLAEIEPRAQRTFTPSLAMIARSAGCYHWTADGRKLADFTSGVLVANLGHNPARWWQSVWQHLGLDRLPDRGDGFAVATPLTSYNATCEIEVEASERLIENLAVSKGQLAVSKFSGLPVEAKRFKRPFGRARLATRWRAGAIENRCKV